MTDATTKSHRVLQTPELLEAILAQLPLRDLLLSQRISRTFKSAIDNSPLLQQLLFFRAQAPTKNPEYWTINPLLRDAFLPWFIISTSRWDAPEYSTIESWMCETHGNSNGTRAGSGALTRKEASWRRMLFVQPPPRKLRIAEIVSGMGGDSTYSSELDFSEGEGVTMDALYDIPYEFLRLHLVSYFGVGIRNSGQKEQMEPPKLTLYLYMVVQCCGEDPPPVSEFQSEARKDWLKGVELKDQGGGDDEECDGWSTDLTPAKWGVYIQAVDGRYEQNLSTL